MLFSALAGHYTLYTIVYTACTEQYFSRPFFERGVSFSRSANFFLYFFLGTSAAWSGPRALLSTILFLISDVQICQILEDLSFTLHVFCKSISQKKLYRKPEPQTLKATPQAIQSCEMCLRLQLIISHGKIQSTLSLICIIFFVA